MALSNKKASFTEGPLFFRMLMFTLPIMLSGLLQVAYNMADNIVVGSFSGDDLALAAVGSTSSMTSIIVNLLVGLGTGAGVVIAQAFGSKDSERTEKSVHTAITFSVVAGLLFAVLTFAFSEPLLRLLNTKDELFASALLYFRWICIGIPASTIYNFSASVMRSVGNSKTPLYILMISGLVNVILNIFFVIVCHMTVDGVAIATVVSQYISAVWLILILISKRDEPYGLKVSKLGINAPLLAKIIRYGLPAGLQGALFGVSNAMLTSAVNSLPTTAVSAKTIAFNIDGIAYTAMNSYLHSAMTFIGQNYGAKRLDRIKKSAVYAIVQVTMLGVVIALILLGLSEPIISMYLDASNPDREVIMETTKGLMILILSLYWLCGIMDTLSGILRGLGNSLSPMLICVIGTLGIRAIWIYVFFPMPTFNNLNGLYYCYPITWIITILAMLAVLVYTAKKLSKNKEFMDAKDK